MDKLRMGREREMADLLFELSEVSHMVVQRYKDKVEILEKENLEYRQEIDRLNALLRKIGVATNFGG